MRILAGMPEQGAQGGPAACEPPFIEELRHLGHDVEEAIYVYAKVNLGFHSRAQRVLTTARLLRQQLRQARFDLIHINTSFDARALMRDAMIVPRLRSEHTKIFLKFHGSDAALLKTKNPALAVMRRRVLTNADGIGVLSSEERANFLDAGVSAEKVFLVKNVVEERPLEPDSEFFKRWGLPEDRPLLLFIGRFIPAKGLLDVILASGLLRDDGQKFLLLCVGDGPTRTEAEALTAKLGLQPSVRFFGYLPEEQTQTFYAQSTMLLFPTYHIEGFPMVIFNAAANGLPIITTQIRAAADYLREPQNCLWVKPRQPEMLAEKISQLLHDTDLRLDMAAKNRALARAFSADIVAAEYLSIYRQLLVGVSS